MNEMPERVWKWETAETAFLSKRMAYRVVLSVNAQKVATPKKRREMPIKQLILAGLGQHDMEQPEWYPDRLELSDYDDDWDDWTDQETRVLIRRLESGANLAALRHVFRIPDHIDMGDKAKSGSEAEKRAGDTPSSVAEDYAAVVANVEAARYDVGHFSATHITDDQDRRYANQRWEAYSERIDLEHPANQTTIEMMIILEIQFQATTKLLNKKDAKQKKETLTAFKIIRTEYSKAAGDVAMLEEKNKKSVQDTLDSVIMRTHEVRKDWRSMEIENEMSTRNLYALVEEFHKTALEKEDEDETEIKIPVPTTKPSPDFATVSALAAVKQSESGDMDLVVESDG